LLRCIGDQGFAWICQFFLACGDVHTVTKNIFVLKNYIADVNASPQTDNLMSRQTFMNADCAVNRIRDTGKLDDLAVTHTLDDGAIVLADYRLEQFAAQLAQGVERARLILAHQATVIHHIGGQYGGKSAFQGSFLPSPVYYPIWCGILDTARAANGTFRGSRHEITISAITPTSSLADQVVDH
jgi:hypothetical protein